MIYWLVALLVDGLTAIAPKTGVLMIAAVAGSALAVNCMTSYPDLGCGFRKPPTTTTPSQAQAAAEAELRNGRQVCFRVSGFGCWGALTMDL